MIAIFLSLLIAAPKFPSDGELDQAIGLYQRGEFNQAINVLYLLSRSSPSDADVRLWLGKSYLKVHQWDRAVVEIETAVRLEPSKAQNHLWLGRACGARAAHSIFLTALAWARKVVRSFETAKKLSPEDLDVRFDLLQYYLEAPGAVGGSREKADAEAQAIARLSPSKGYIARAMVLQRARQWEQARKELVRATVLYPEEADVHKDLSEFLLDQHEYDGAFASAKKALRLDGGSQKVRLLWAASATALRTDLDEAMRLLRELARGPLGDEDPSFEEVYYWLGECYLARGERAKARESFETALVFNPDYERAKISFAH